MKLSGLALVIGASLLLGGCSASNDPLADQANEGTVTSLDGATTEIAVSSRTDAVTFSTSDTTDGSIISTQDLRGNVVVVNFWFASCPPCRLEAPELAKLSRAYDGTDVRFIGVNVYDDRAAANAFEGSFGIPYPSALDVDTGSVRLAFAGSLPPNGVPVTLILDREGRVAARFSGAIIDGSILEDMIERVRAEATS